MSLLYRRHAVAACLLLASAGANAQFDSTQVVLEPAAVAERFPDPDVRYPTPAFRDGRMDFPSHAEVLAYLDALARESNQIRIETIGQSQRGLPMPMAVLSAHGPNAKLPTVMIVAQQHGNEPAGGEAALVLAQQLAGSQRALLDRVNVLIVPRANPDGAERFVRTTQSGVDVNRDHLLLRTPEARAIAAATLKYKPHVMLDLHEFTVAGRWVDKFGAMQKYDALLQPATVGNLDPRIAAAAQTTYVERLHQVWSANALTSFEYYTTAPDPRDKVVSMGGVQPDTGRNTGGLRPAISLLLEVRGVGLGQAHLLRRVHTQVLAGMAVVETAAAQGRRLVQLVRRAEADTQALACQGELVIAARHRSTHRELVLVDSATGADKVIEVEWRAAQPLVIQRTRSRPCGYLVASSEVKALERLRLLGVRLRTVAEAGRWEVERYRVISEAGGQRQDARGAIDDGADNNIRLLQVKTERESLVVAPGTVYVPLDQPRAGLITAALEPDSQSSYAANRLLDVDQGQLWRVRVKPPAALLRRD